MIVDYSNERHRTAVIDLWITVFGYDSARNDPALSIDKKRVLEDGLFWVVEVERQVAGTLMAGYDGHRGWLYSLAVREEYRGRGLASQLVSHAEAILKERGCVKVNLQIVEGNRGVESFYRNLGFATEPRISMGKELL